MHVVDGSNSDPEGQIAAVHEVMTDIDAMAVPELVVINKIDAADPETLARLRHAVPGAVFVSARTGEGLDDLIAALDAGVPHPSVEVTALVPYDRGELISRIHRVGEVLSVEHRAEGTIVQAKVHPDLAGLLAPFAVTPVAP